MKKAKDGIAGVILGLIAELVLIWQGLLVYSEATKRPLVGGGIFGLMVGMILGSNIPARTSLVIVVGVVGTLAIASFNQIVQGDLSFPGRQPALYLLSSVIAACLSFLGAKISEIVRGSSRG